MKQTSLAILLLAFAVAGCTSTPSESIADTPGNAPLMVTAKILTPTLELVRPAIVSYPPGLYSAGVSGQVKVSLEINRAGEVTMAQVTESTDKRLEVASIRGALKLRFKRGPLSGDILFDFKSPNPPSTAQPVVTTKAPLPAAAFEGDYVQIEDCDVKPKLTRAVQPVYPASLSNRGLDGSVDVAFIVTTSGLPTQIRILKADHPDLAASVIAAVAQWRFTPGQTDGKLVACLAQQNLSFSTNTRNN